MRKNVFYYLDIYHHPKPWFTNGLQNSSVDNQHLKTITHICRIYNPTTYFKISERFSSHEGVVEAFKSLVSEVPLSEWEKCFEDFLHRIQKCIDAKGESFEMQSIDYVM